MVGGGVSSSEPLLLSSDDLSGLEEKTSIKTDTVDINTFNPIAASCRPSQNHAQGLTFNLENIELPEGFNLSSSLDELLHTDDQNSPESGFVRSTKMDKLQVLKADVLRALEIRESGIDSLEYELKSLISDGASCSFPTAPSSLPLRDITSSDMPRQRDDGFLEEHTAVEDLDEESPVTSKFLKPITVHPDAIERMDLDLSSDHASDDMLGVTTSCGDNSQVPTGSSSTVSVGGTVQYGREDTLYDLILASNRVLANRASDEFCMILPTTHLCTKISRATDEALVNKQMTMRKHFLKFKERVITLKFRALQYFWKKNLRLSSHEMFEYANKLLSDSQIRIYRNTLKMPSFILDRRERLASRFISDNGLVENPIDVENERLFVNPWTAEEKQVFLDNYSSFGKDFRKIAECLQHKTIADCVEFYYKNRDYFPKAKKKSEFAKKKTYLVVSRRRLNLYVGMCHGDSSILERSNNFAMFCNEHVVATSGVMGSCITSLVDHRHQVNRRCQKFGGKAVRSFGKDFLMISLCLITKSRDRCRVLFSKACKCLGLDVIALDYVGESATHGDGGRSDHDDTCMVTVTVLVAMNHKAVLSWIQVS